MREAVSRRCAHWARFSCYSAAGVCPQIVACPRSKKRFSDMVLVASASVLLLGPGVFYHLAAHLIRRHDVTMALLARRTAIIQSSISVAALALMLISGGIAKRRWHWNYRCCPATASVFFSPALLGSGISNRKGTGSTAARVRTAARIRGAAGCSAWRLLKPIRAGHLHRHNPCLSVDAVVFSRG